MKLLYLSLCFALTVGLPGVTGAKRNKTVRKIVVFHQSVSPETKQHVLDRGKARKIKTMRHGEVVTVSEESVATLAASSGVLRVDEDVQVETQVFVRPTPVLKPTKQEIIPWGITQVHAPDAWPIATGNSVKIGVVDTGIDLTHPDLMANIHGSVNLINPRKSGNDDNGHGSHVAGIIAGIQNNTRGVVGVSPKASLYAIKVLNSQGTGYISDIIEGLDWAIDNDLDVINLSLGTTSDILSLREAIDRASGAGITIIAAAGNNYGGAVLYPAAYENVIAVAATDPTNTATSFSARGGEIDVVAPGLSILSTYRRGTYQTATGTSMAAPHVTGAVALILSHPQVCDSNGDNACNTNEIINRLYSTAQDVGLPGQDTSTGAGIIDTLRAIAP